MDKSSSAAPSENGSPSRAVLTPQSSGSRLAGLPASVVPLPKKISLERQHSTEMDDNSSISFSSLPSSPIGEHFLTVSLAKAGPLSKKNDLLNGGRRAQLRAWRSFWVELFGSELVFYKDQNKKVSSVSCFLNGT